MKKITLFIASIISLNLQAQENGNGGVGPADADNGTISCKLNEVTPKVISHLSSAPEWFAKVFPDGKRMSYISGGNHFLNIEETDIEKRVLNVPGDIDPVPSPDGKIITVPGMVFYSVNDIEKNGSSSLPIHEDYEFGSVYQSVGLLKTSADGKSATYRVVNDFHGEVYHRDYTFDVSGEDPKFVTQSEKLLPLCPGRQLKTIMVSKTGKYVSVYDPQSGTTKLISTDGQCSELLDLGIATGKIEFSHDDTKISFHVDYFSTDQFGEYFNGVNASMSKDIYVMDLAVQSDGKLLAGKLSRLTSTMRKDVGGYYPSFTKNGDVAFLYDYGDSYAVHIVDPSDARQFNYNVGDFKPTDQLQPVDAAKLNAAAAIGSLWLQKCQSDIQEDEVTAIGAASIKLAIPLEECQKLVSGSWTPEIAEAVAYSNRIRRDPRLSGESIKSLASAQLLEFCSDTAAKPRQSLKFGEPGKDEEMTGQKALERNCVGCHTAGAVTPFSVKNLTETSILDAMARLTTDSYYRMPMNGLHPAQITRADGTVVDVKTMILDYLSERLVELRKTPPAPAVVAASSPTQCLPDRDGWLKFRDGIASGLSQGVGQNMTATTNLLETCSTQVKNLGLATCMSNLTKYARVMAPRPGGQHKLGFEVSDDKYYERLKNEGRIDIVALPGASEGIDLSNGIPENWREIVASSNGKVKALQYRSRTVANPGPSQSLNRLLFLVEGEKYDKWIQFTLPEPTTFGANFDPMGNTAPEQLVDFIGIDKTKTPKQLFFSQYWRDSNGKNPKPRMAALAKHLLGEVPAGVPNNSDTCYSCHANGMRQLSPQPASVGQSQFETLSFFNTKMVSYGRLDWAGAITTDAYGPPMGQTIGCATCHNNGGADVVQKFSRGPINPQFSRGHLSHKLTGDMSMPMSNLIYNEVDDSGEFNAINIAGHIKYLDSIDPAITAKLTRDYIQRQRSGGGSGYPAPKDFIKSLTDFGLFTAAEYQGYAYGWPGYIAYEYELSGEKMISDIDKINTLRSTWFNTQLNPGSSWYRNELANWINESCEISGDED